MAPPRLIFGLLALTLVTIMAPAAVAQDGTVTLTVEAKESGCVETYCWEFEGDTDAIDAGATVEITVRNPNSNSANHNFFIKEGSGAQGGTDPGSDTLASTDDLAPGEEETLRFTVPDDVDELYYWCDVAGHESLGMFGSWSVSSDGTDGGDGADGADGDGEGEANSQPGFGMLAALAALGLTAFVLARRR